MLGDYAKKSEVTHKWGLILLEIGHADVCRHRGGCQKEFVPNQETQSEVLFYQKSGGGKSECGQAQVALREEGAG